MFKKEWQKVLVMIVIAVLFGLVVLTAYQFVKEPENVDIDVPSNEVEKPTVTFQNLSSLTEAEILELAEDKREELRSYFASVPAYYVSEVFDGFTSEDDETYMGLGSNFLDGLHLLITDEFYDEIMEQLETGTKKEGIALKEEVYIAKDDIFDDYFFRSAITLDNYNQEELILKKATDDRIDMIENIKYCREDMKDICMRDDKYDYVLEKVGNEYKIAKIR